MSDGVDIFMNTGVVLAAWGALGWIASFVWKPAILLTVPIIGWVIILACVVAIGVPVMKVYHAWEA